MMSTPFKSSTSDKLLGLLIISGFLMLITALPLGIVMSLQDRYKFHDDWHWAIIWGPSMTIATAIVGGLFTCIGEFIVKRRWKQQGKNDKP